MIRKLQKKFISIAAIALFLMILTVMGAVNGLFFYQTNKMLDSRLEELLQPGNPVSSHAPDAPDFSAEQPKPPKPMDNPGMLGHFEDRLNIRFDGCLISLNDDGSIREIYQDGAKNYTEEDLSPLVAEIVSAGKTKGWHQYYKFCLETREDSSGSTETVLGLINASSNLYSVFTMLLISAGIGILSFLLALLIIVLASKHAVKPIAESYLKQKQFVTDAGHELKTPLTVISANNELLRMIYGDSEWFDGIDKQVAKMNGLVRSLITLAKMDEEQKPVFSVFNLSDAVYDTAKSFENLVHSQGKLITFNIAENILYFGDESKLRQLVSILIDNAVKYCDDKGKIGIHLTDNKYICLQVINDFEKADTCDFKKVFERFYRADKARVSDGSFGLGLSIAKSIAELHKGEIFAKPIEHNRVLFEVHLRRG